MAVLAKQSGPSSHWYTLKGRPAHRQPKANGDGERSTNVRDAKRLNLIPSVTTILNVLGKSGLVNWQLEQVGLVAFDQRPTDGESRDYYAKRIVGASKETTDDAATAGSAVHAAIEAFYDGEEVPDDLKPYVTAVESWRESKKLTFIERETILVNRERGFAGMCDVVALGAQGQQSIIDWKTRKTSEGKKVRSYETEVMQIAAYAATRWGEEEILKRRVYGANVYVSRNEVGRVEVRAWSPGELFEAYQTFLSCHAIWRYLKNYDPRS